jgi:hypothetical protein
MPVPFAECALDKTVTGSDQRAILKMSDSLRDRRLSAFAAYELDKTVIGTLDHAITSGSQCFGGRSRSLQEPCSSQEMHYSVPGIVNRQPLLLS